MKATRYFVVVVALAAVAGLMWLYKGKDWLIRDAIVSATEKATGVRSEEHTSELPVTPISRMPSSA